MIGMEIIVIIIIWVLLGILSCKILWYVAFKDPAPKYLVVYSVIFGPIALVAHVLGFLVVMWLRVYDKFIG